MACTTMVGHSYLKTCNVTTAICPGSSSTVTSDAAPTVLLLISNPTSNVCTSAVRTDMPRRLLAAAATAVGCGSGRQTQTP